MKAVRLVLALFAMLFVLAEGAFAQSNVGIGTTAPDNSAILDLTSTTKGLLIPRMTQSQRNGIPSPATGLLVFCTDSLNSSNPSTFYYYNGTAWVPFLGAGWLLLGNSGTTPTSNYLGTRDSVDFVIRTNATERVRVYAGGNVGLINSNNTAEELRFYEPSDSGTNYTSFRAGIQSGNVAYVLPSSDGTSAQVLTTDGSGNLGWRSFGFVGGGGVDTLWRRGSGTLALEGVGSGNTASGAYAMAAGLNCTASGANAIVFGDGNLGSGQASTVSGGINDTASGAYSVCSGGNNNDATGSYSSVVGGSNNKACGNYSVVVGGYNNTACGDYSAALGGSSNTVSGNYSLVFGIGGTVTQDNSIVFYHNNGATKVGIGNTAPSEALDVTGSVRFSGALMPNNSAGTSGYVLASTGTNSAPVWTAASNLYWSTLGNTGTSPSTNYLGTTDAQALVFRTAATERMRVLSTGQLAINTTTTTHQVHSLYSGTTDEVAAVYGNATGATTSQSIGVWGRASNTSTSNTGTIGVLATGNGNSSAGQTNVALQLNDGEFAMGRTTETPSVGSVVEGAAAGTSYSQQGPSGVIELTLGAAGNLVTTAPIAGTYQNLGTLTINNRYTTSSSIVLVNVLSKIDDGVAPDAKSASYFVDVDNRTAGAFDIRVGMIPTITNVSNYSSSDKIRIGYTIINAGK